MAIRSSDVAALMEFLDAVRAARDLRSVGTTLDDTIRRLGFGHFSMRVRRTVESEGNPYFGVWTYPKAWNQHFNASRYYATSPVFTFAEALTRPFNWFELLANPSVSSTQRRIFSEIGEFGIGMGLTVPIHLPTGFLAVFAIASDPALDPTADVIRAHEATAHLLGLGFYEKAAPLLYGQRLALREPPPPSHAANDDAPPGQIETPARSYGDVTPFERECLAWSAAGAGSWAISERLSFSETAVRHAFESARVKLGAATYTHAVVRAIALDLVAP